ncbi:MAG TPA: tyrosine-type recombinase/integrase [Candidatus Acidoferrales bacterium]|nr:tyrosine-type recombinase/integrase [Candidatus Acidoferrales bacterium]
MRENSRQADKRLQRNSLGFYLGTFATSLLEYGYTDGTIHSKLWLLGDLERWLRRTKLAVTHLDERFLEAFLKHKRRVRRGEPKTLQQFLDHLRKLAAAPGRKAVRDKSPLANILSRYETYLRSERGLVPVTILNYQAFVRKFLLERFREGPFRLREIKPSDISDFVLQHGRSMAVRRAQLMTTAFRSFFRFLFQKGELHADLAASVPTVAAWRLSTVPKHLTPEEVERVLKACNCATASGRRDYAVLLLLARLGLRAGEVVALELDDINWRAGEITVRGKGLFHDRMPLPADVGKALASYLRRDRPACQTRRVFVCMKAPPRGFAGPGTLTTIVRRALARADLHPIFKGAHLLRHSLATSMLGSGATLGEIGEVLRHRTPNTTQIYAKVDFEGLRSLAHPWPMGGGQ